MRSLGIIVAAGLLAAAAQAANAQDAAANGDSAAPGPIHYTDSARHKEQISCHTMVHEGVLAPRPACSSEREWKNAQSESQKSIRDLQQRSYSTQLHH